MDDWSNAITLVVVVGIAWLFFWARYGGGDGGNHP